MIVTRPDVAIGLQFRRAEAIGVKQFVEASQDDVGCLAGVRLNNQDSEGDSDDRS